MIDSRGIRTAAFACLALAAVFALVWGATYVPASAAEEEEGGLPDVMTLDSCGEKKGLVEFPHTAHFEFSDCVTCHHTTEGLTLENVAETEVETCVSCHFEPADSDVPDCSSMSLKKNAYHISCVGCHKDMDTGEEAYAAPTRCNDCHAKD